MSIPGDPAQRLLRMAVAVVCGVHDLLGLSVETGLAVMHQTIADRRPAPFADTILSVLNERAVGRPGEWSGDVVRFRDEFVGVSGDVHVEGDWDTLVAEAAPDCTDGGEP